MEAEDSWFVLFARSKVFYWWAKSDERIDGNIYRLDIENFDQNRQVDKTRRMYDLFRIRLLLASWSQ